MNFTFSATAALFATLASGLLASPFNEATLSRVVNQVTVVQSHEAPRRAVVNAVVSADASLCTEQQSRAELVFTDGTLARVGAATVLGLRRGTRELTLDRGTLLLEVPNFRGGARVCAGSLTVVCGGATILVEHLPSRSLKLVVLEGDVRIAAGGFLGDSIVIPPGKMLITAPNAKRIPDPVEVDLGTLVKTSGLIDPATFGVGAAPLASLPRIQKEIERQTAAFGKKRLIPTNLAIVGSGTNVVIPIVGSEEEPIANATNDGTEIQSTEEAELRNSERIAVRRQPTGSQDVEIPLTRP